MDKKPEKNASNIHSGHRKRMREKYRKLGFEGFSEHEILELILYYAIPRKNTNEIAHKLIKHFGSFLNVLDADFKELSALPYMTENSALFLTLFPSVLNVYTYERLQKSNVCDFDNISDYFVSMLSSEDRECLYAAYLNSSLNVINAKKIVEGDINGVKVNLKNIVKMSIECESDLLIIGHNHPDGKLIPSDSDVSTTRYLYNSLKPLGVTLLDHIIVAAGKSISLKELGVFINL
jgi:DNA repair protein RadC